MKVVIAGAGEVGTFLAKMLCNGYHDVVVIDDMYPERLRSLDSQFDLLVLKGYPISPEILHMANIKKADLFIAVTPYETTNISAAIIAKKLGAKTTVARVDNNEFTLEENRLFFKELGIDNLIYPEQLAAIEIKRLLALTATTKVFEFSGGKLFLYVFKLEDTATLAGQTLLEFAAKEECRNFRVVAITRNSSTIIPRGSDQFQANDLLYVIGNHNDISSLREYTGAEEYEIKNVMILGGSKIGKQTAKLLEKDYHVKLLEPEKEKSSKLADYLEKTLVLNADGCNEEVLIQEGVRDMDAFISVTGNSETNIIASLLAKKLGIRKTITEVENMDFVNLATSMGLISIINKKLIAASNIFRYTSGAEISAVQCLAGTDAEVLEFVVHESSKIAYRPLKNISFPDNAIVGGYVRNGAGFIANGLSKFEPGDRVVVFSQPTSIGKVADFFK